MASLFLKTLLLGMAYEEDRKEAYRRRMRHQRRIRAETFRRRLLSTDVCRVCNKPEGCVSVFESTGMGNATIAQEIKNFSGVQILKNDKYSKKICSNCLSVLNKCLEFRAKCQETDKLMKTDLLKAETISCNAVEESDDYPDFGDFAAAVEVKVEELPGSVEHGAGSDDDNIPSPSFSEDYSYEFRCVCLQEFENTALLKEHKRTCEPHKASLKQPRLCDICGQTFASKHSLISHIGTHGTNAFPFKCDQCQYRGRTIDLLRTHQRTHMSDKPFKCNVCSHSTTTRSNLNYHYRRKHAAKKVKCDHCDKMFAEKTDVKRHIREAHMSQDSAHCDICAKTFVTRKGLRRHKIKVHKMQIQPVPHHRAAYVLSGAADIDEQIEADMTDGQIEADMTDGPIEADILDGQIDADTTDEMNEPDTADNSMESLSVDANLQYGM